MKHGAVLSSADIPNSASQITATPGATVTLDVATGHVAKWTASENETINASGAQHVGQELTCIITNDATLARTITFNTGFRALATIIGTTSKVSVIRFISDGTNFIEVSRTVAIT